MNTGKLRAAIDAAYSAAVLGAVLVIFRRQITPILAKARADMEARAKAVEAEADRVRKQREFVGYLREHGIEPTRYDLGMES